MGAIFLLGRESGGGRLRRGQDPSLRGKRYMGGNGKVEGRACPAPTDWRSRFTHSTYTHTPKP